jgi:hypothetical protein
MLDTDDPALWYAINRLITNYWADVGDNGGSQAHEFYEPAAVYTVGANRFEGADRQIIRVGGNIKPSPITSVKRQRFQLLPAPRRSQVQISAALAHDRTPKAAANYLIGTKVECRFYARSAATSALADDVVH